MPEAPEITIHRDADAGFAPVARDYVLPARFAATVVPAEPDLPICHLELVVEHGRAVCERLHLERKPGGRALSGQLLRKVNVRDYVRQAAEEAGRFTVAVADATVTIDGETHPLHSGLRRPVPVDDHVAVPINGMTHTPEYKAATRAPRGQGRVTEETLREVADVYRTAHAKQQSPTLAVMAEWHVSRTTASRWIRRAREAGFLRAARPRVAGEF